MKLLRSVFVCLVPLLTSAGLLSAQSVQYVVVSRDLIELRLKLVPKTNEERSAAVQALFEQEQCVAPNLTTQKIKRSKIPNVICELPGATGRVIIVGAHFDKVTNGDGAVDNWSGASLLPSLYKSLGDQKRKHTFRFIEFSEEEQGLFGSKDYVRGLEKQEVRDIAAMVNIDSIGLSPTKVWVTRADKNLLAKLNGVAQSVKVPLSGMNVEQVGDSDSRPFYEKKIPVIDIHSITQETLPILHSPNDQLSAINLDDYYDTYRLLAAYLAYLDSTLTETPFETK